MPHIDQPNASRMPADVLDGVLGSLSLCGACAPESIVHRGEFSNDFAEVRLANGTALVVKRGRFDWSRPRFDSSRAASRLIRRKTDLVVPNPLPLPEELSDPVEAYWRIDLPTLMELWPTMSAAQKAESLRSWGEVAGELHSIELTGFGPLSVSRNRAGSLTEMLRSDLMKRLLPAVIGEWPEAEPALRRLDEAVPEVNARVGQTSRLTHGDLHMGNVLCERRGRLPRCVGLIDLETAQAAPPESDLAIMELHHGELFDHPIKGDWLSPLMEGYDRPVDSWTIAFYRAYHLLNLGFYSALIGHAWHADRVVQALNLEMEGLAAR